MKSLDEERNRKSYQSLEEASPQDIDEVTRLECFHDPARIRKALNKRLLKLGSDCLR
jgi:hypothetical protein